MSIAEQLSSTYDPRAVEPAIRSMWESGGYFHPDPANQGEPFVIVIPPPNVTGALHGGHALNNTLQDILIRWHRMRGFNTLWMPGTDHAGIATQAVVERKIFENEKKSRHDLGRDEMVRRIWDWKEQYGNRIIEQLKLMGCSCDWERTRFTLDDICARAVRETFFRLFKDGLIFRGKRLVNWDTQLQTAVADDEVYHETVKGHFYHFKYPVIDPKPGEPEFVHIATTRPETMLGDTAVAVHPDPASALDKVEKALRDELAGAAAKEKAGIEKEIEALVERRATMLPLLEKLRDMANDGRMLRLPLVDRPIPLICDIWAKPELGSGCVKITPAHDPNDYEVGQRHKLPMVNVLTPDGKVARIIEPDGTENANSSKYEGLKFSTLGRKKVVEDLEALGLVEKIEDRMIDVGHSDRSKTAIEPYLSDQWFVRMGDLTEREASSVTSAHMRTYLDEPRASARADVRSEGTVHTETETARAEARGSSVESTSKHFPGLAQLAMDQVCEQNHASAEERRACGKVHFFPSRYAKTYLDWLKEKRDWCISRQLWWGHRILVWRLKREAMLPAPGNTGYGKIKLSLLEKLETRFELAPYIQADPASDGPVAEGVMYVCLADEPTENDRRLLDDAGFEQDPDVLDTWFSSALWPHSTMGWPEGTAEMQRYYPGSVLSTAREIITLWVARMVLTGMYNIGKPPFHDVYIHAVIQDGQGRPFKKTLGNGFDPVDIIDAYGADALRYTMAAMTTETQDIRMPMKTVVAEDGRELQSSEKFELGRNFCNKLWNAARFAFMNLEHNPQEPRASARADTLSEGTVRTETTTARAKAQGSSVESLPIEDRWILSRTSAAAREVQGALLDFQFSRAMNAARDFFWDELCDWYLELVKARVRDDRRADEARQVLAFVLDQSLRLLHPFMPFITEQLWSHLNTAVRQRGLPGVVELDADKPLIASTYPPVEGYAVLNAPDVDAVFDDLRNATRAVRDIRQTQNVPPKQSVDVTIKVPANRVASLEHEAHVLKQMAGVGKLTIDPNAAAPKNAATLVLGDMQIYVADVIDAEQERARLQKELENIDKQIKSIEGKLGNESFTARAPADVVARERERLEEFKAKRVTVETTMKDLGG